jgi:hypothetical protein
MMPTIAYGKGFGNFDVQCTLGGFLLLIRTDWDEPRPGTTHFNIECSGSCGLKQNFVTPTWFWAAFIYGEEPASPLAAAISFHMTNHNTILSIRFPF